MEKLTKKFNLYELIGVILGDGCIYYYPDRSIYGLEIAGNAEEDKEYFEKIANYISSISNKMPSITIRHQKNGKYLKLMINDKKFTLFLINKLGIPYKNKTENAKIPNQFINWKFSKHILRGLFETDGSLYFSKLTYLHKYPRIEIKTKSKFLSKQLYSILLQKAFKVNKRTDKEGINRVYLSGHTMLDMWEKEIGFGSIRTLSKYLIKKKLGHYIPRSTTKERLILLNNN